MTGFHLADLTLDLFADGITHGINGVDVLDLGLGVKDGLAFDADGHIGITAQMGFFHIGFRNAQPAQQLAQADEVLPGFIGGTQIWPRDHFYQRHTAAVEIDEAQLALILCFASVFFNVQFPNTYAPHIRLFISRSTGRDGQVDITTLAQ